MENGRRRNGSDECFKTLKSRTVKEEFSEAASKPIKHNPEAVNNKNK